MILQILSNLGTAFQTLFATLIAAITILLTGAAASVLAIGGVNLAPILERGATCGSSP